MPKNDEDQVVDDDDEERKENRALRLLAASPTKFSTLVLGFKPFPYQMRMLEDPSKNIIVCAARRVGKSLVMANKALWFAFCHPGTSTLIVAATQRQSMLMFDKLLDYVSTDPLKDSVVRQTRTLLTFTNRSRIVALPCGRTGKTIRGESADLIIVDEAAFVPDDVILSAMMPMLATTDGTIIMLSTPWDKGSFFYRAFNSPIWSKYRFKTADNPMVKKEWLEQQVEMVGKKRFKQEYLDEFVDDEGTYFSMNILRPCIHICSDTLQQGAICSFCASNIEGGKIVLSPTSTIELYAGYDPGGMMDPAALVVVQKVRTQETSDKGEDGEQEFKPAFRVLLTRTFSVSKKKAQSPNNKSRNEGELYTRFNVAIAEIHRISPFRGLLVDSTGIGSPIISHLRELRLPVEGMNMHRKNKEEIFSNLRILFETRKIEVPDSMELLSSLNCIVAEPDRIGGYVFSHPSGTHDDLAYALALAVWKGGKGGGKGVVMKDEPPKPSTWRVSQWGDQYRY